MFLTLCFNWKVFKKDLGLTSDDHNKVEDDVSTIEYNDSWMQNTKEEYYVLIEKSEEKLAEAIKSPAAAAANQEDKVQVDADLKAKQDVKLAESLSKQLENLCDGITASIGRIAAEVRNMVDGGESVTTVQFLRLDLQTLSDKIDGPMNTLLTQYICHLGDSEVKEKEAMRTDFSKREKTRIDQLLFALSKKVKEAPSGVQSSGSGAGSEKKEKVFIKMTDPPKWDGDPIN